MLQKYTISENTCYACSVKRTKIVFPLVLSNPNKLVYSDVFLLVCVCVNVRCVFLSDVLLLWAVFAFCIFASDKNMNTDNEINRMDGSRHCCRLLHSHINWSGGCFFAHQPTYFYPFLALHAWNCDIFRVWENASSHLSLKFYKPTNQPSDQPTEMSIQHFQNDKFTYISTVLFVEHPFGIMLCHSSTKWTAAILSFLLLRLQQDAIYGMEIYVLITNCIFHLVNSVQRKMVRANFKANETLTMRNTKHEKIEYKKKAKIITHGLFII